MTFIETLFVTLVRLSFSFASRDIHLLLLISGALLYGPLTKLIQFTGFVVLVVLQCARQLKESQQQNPFL